MAPARSVSARGAVVPSGAHRGGAEIVRQLPSDAVLTAKIQVCGDVAQADTPVADEVVAETAAPSGMEQSVLLFVE